MVPASVNDLANWTLWWYGAVASAKLKENIIKHETNEVLQGGKSLTQSVYEEERIAIDVFGLLCRISFHICFIILHW